jgi:hypothetical protein
MSIIPAIQRIFAGIFLYIFRLTSFAFRRLRFAGRGVAFEDKVSDFFDIFKTTVIFFIFNLLALFVFTLLPQGKDVILIVIEDLSSFSPWSLLSLLAGLLGWCIISEFGVRYKIYVTDNSGLSLTDERVNFRKEAQRFVSSIYLLLPVVIVMISITIVSFNSIQNWHWHDIWPFTTVLLLLVLTFALLSKFYLDSFYINKLREKEVWYKVRAVELNWANKLYGIYNDYVFMVRKSSNFKDADTTKEDKDKTKDPPPNTDIRNTYNRFTNLIEALPGKNKTTHVNTIESFPRDFLKDNELAPIEFSEVTYHPDNFTPGLNEERGTDKSKPEFVNKPNPDGYYRWIYKNNPSFFKTLHLQIHVIAISSLLFMLLISTRLLISYEAIGSPALVCLSFACWLGIYTGLLYIDSRFKKKLKISVRWVLFFWLLLMSFINNDHPVRGNGTAGFINERFALSDHFELWTKKHLSDTSKSWIKDMSISSTDTTANKDSVYYPVYFITAEGGALRTGAFSAMLLAKLQDLFPDFKKHIYAFSTVSGGSVGISFFNAISYLEPNGTTKAQNYYQTITRKFFEQDQLSPVLAKLFYADVLNNFWPKNIEKFDRAIALEKAWEHSYHNVFGRNNDKNVFSTNFLSCYSNTDTNQAVPPAWFINTAEVESGLQCYISNVRADSFVFERQRDLLAEKIHYGINYSTAVNFSSRFPLFSPSAALYQDDDRTYHYVDGGYVENTGSKTMLEIIQRLHNRIKGKKILPYVIQLKFSDSDSSKFAQTGFLNEISSIISGIYNTRAGSSAINTELLRREVESLHGQIINVPLPATSKDIPMSWVFSNKSLANLDSVIKHVMEDKTNDLNTKLPYLRRLPHSPSQ